MLFLGYYKSYCFALSLFVDVNLTRALPQSLRFVSCDAMQYHQSLLFNAWPRAFACRSICSQVRNFVVLFGLSFFVLCCLSQSKFFLFKRFKLLMTWRSFITKWLLTRWYEATLSRLVKRRVLVCVVFCFVLFVFCFYFFVWFLNVLTERRTFFVYVYYKEDK